MTIRFSLQMRTVDDGAEVADLAGEVESLGYESLRIPDHVGATLSPFATLSYAAASTSTLRLGPYVLNAGMWHPLDLARETATLDRLSGGRAFLGLGAGHTPAEWAQRGLVRPTPADRVTHMIELASCTTALLAGETVTDDHFGLRDAELPTPRPVQEPVPLLIGGGNPRLLDYAAAHAHTIGFTGLGATLPDGHGHDTRWSPADVDALFEPFRSRTGPRVDVLVQHVELTDDRAAAAATMAADLGATTADDLLAAPFVLIGTEEDILAQVRRQLTTLGAESYCVRGPALHALAPIVAELLADGDETGPP